MSSRRELLRWAGWFAAANGVVFALVGLRFLWGYPLQWDLLGAVYGVLAFVGHFALLAALPVGLCVVPLIVILPRKWPVTVVAVLLGALALTLLVVDGNVFAEHRYHLTPLVALLFEPVTWVLVGIIACMAVAFEALLAGFVRRRLQRNPPRGGRWLAAALCAAWAASQLIHMWADAIGHTPVTQLTRYLPAYFPIHAKRTLARLGLVDAATVERQRLVSRAGTAAAGQLNYPLRPLSCTPPARRLNVLVLMIDALRPDAVVPALLPELAALRAQSAEFASHWSGGNSSRAGLFSLFYGLPATYFEAFYGVQQAPVLVEHMRAAGYQLALFSAPGFSTPTDMARTAFAGTAGLGGERRDLGASARNRAVTDGWLEWLGARDATRPFFGFLYYDPPMGDASAAADGPLPLDERYADDPDVAAAWRRYRLALRMVDGEVGRALGALHEAGLADSTVIIATSDHGYEFDDNDLGYMGHASNFSAAQLRATLLVRWPGRDPRRYEHRSSHYDVAPTLLQGVFGCTGDPADYSLGGNLFAGRDWSWLIAGSYNAYAIVEPGHVIVTHPGGFVEVLGADYRPLPRAHIDPGTVGAAMSAMRRFYR
jgi:hypothetical protein